MDQPRTDTGEWLSRIDKGKAHALIGGELIRSCAIIGRKLQKQKPGYAAERRQAQKDRKHITSQTSTEREGDKKRKELILHKRARRRRASEKETWKQEIREPVGYKIEVK